jgi:hypothetical protein
LEQESSAISLSSKESVPTEFRNTKVAKQSGTETPPEDQFRMSYLNSSSDTLPHMQYDQSCDASLHQDSIRIPGQKVEKLK